MQKIIATAIIFLSITVVAIAQDRNQEADQLLKNLVADGHVIGAAAGYAVNGEILWQSAVGYADQKEQIAFTLATITRTASVAKSMTAVAVMQLVERGLIDLDVPIQTYLPDFPIKQEGAITVKHLLSHTSGIPGYKNAKEAESDTEYARLADAVDVFKDRDLDFKPGEKFGYTTYGYVVLGLIVEHVTSLSFAEYMQVNIWDKAGMRHTGVEQINRELPNKSSLYHRSNKGKIKAAAANNLSNRVPGGGFYTTLGDMLTFGNAVINHTLIKESTFAQMIQIHSLEKEGNPYGFGWFLYGPKPYENLVIGHSGEQTGSSTQLMIIPKSKTVVVVLSNTSGAWQEVVGLSAKLIAISEQK